MKGTDQERPRCISLEGQLGEQVRCTIYNNRPSCCRAFEASLESGIRNPRCDKARQSKGFAPLTLADWGREQPSGDESERRPPPPPP